MNDKKWAIVSSITSHIHTLQAQQMEMIQLLIKTLTDEDDDGSKMETDKAVLERV
jgi:hypothetical protein